MSTNAKDAMAMLKQSSTNKKHGLLTYNESERNKKSNSLVPRSVINK